MFKGLNNISVSQGFKYKVMDSISFLSKERYLAKQLRYSLVLCGSVVALTMFSLLHINNQVRYNSFSSVMGYNIDKSSNIYAGFIPRSEVHHER